MTVTQFENYLKCGLGRCVTFLRGAQSRGDYLNAVVYACTHNMCYDAQSEGTRALYGYELARVYNDDDFFTELISRRLYELNKEDDWEFAYLFDLSALFALGGCDKALNVMRREYARLYTAIATTTQSGYDFYRDEYERLCINLVKADRADAERVAQDIGALISGGLYSYDDFDNLYFYFANERKNEIAVLATAAKSDNNIAQFLNGFSGDERTNAARYKCRVVIPTEENEESRADISAEKSEEPTPFKSFLAKNATCESALRARLNKIDFCGDDWHSDICDILDCHKVINLPKFVFEFVYNNSRCSCCRLNCIKAMRERGELTKEIADECRYDSNISVREYIEALQ